MSSEKTCDCVICKHEAAIKEHNNVCDQNCLEKHARFARKLWDEMALGSVKLGEGQYFALLVWDDKGHQSLVIDREGSKLQPSLVAHALHKQSQLVYDYVSQQASKRLQQLHSVAERLLKKRLEDQPPAAKA